MRNFEILKAAMSPYGYNKTSPKAPGEADVNMDEARPEKGVCSAKEIDHLQRNNKNSRTNLLESDLGSVDVVMETQLDKTAF